MKCLNIAVIIAAVLFAVCQCLPAKKDNQMNADEMCRLPPKRGICRAYIERYYYDIKNKACKEFVYGGCYGNENSFESISDCMATCKHVK